MGRNPIYHGFGESPSPEVQKIDDQILDAGVVLTDLGFQELMAETEDQKGRIRADIAAARDNLARLKEERRFFIEKSPAQKPLG